jgi:uncharacterized protein YceH (UPF0502 family)
MDATSAVSAPPQPQSPAATPPPTHWEPLQPLERRILGVLIEKQKTAKSSDSYPLSLNALVTGCNQKTNRDPVLELDELEVEEGLTSLQKKGMVMRMTGGRAEKFRHLLYDLWTKNGPEMAVLAELLLRGPQTKGDLRGRAARMDPIDTLDALDEILKSLTNRRLAVYLTDPDRRGAIVTHGFHTPDEFARLRAHFAHAPASVSEPEASAPRASPSEGLAALEVKFAAALGEIESLKQKVAQLESAVSDLQKQLPSPASTA